MFQHPDLRHDFERALRTDRERALWTAHAIAVVGESGEDGASGAPARRRRTRSLVAAIAGMRRQRAGTLGSQSGHARVPSLSELEIDEERH